MKKARAKQKPEPVFPAGYLPCWTCEHEAVGMQGEYLVCGNCGEARRLPPQMERGMVVTAAEEKR